MGLAILLLNFLINIVFAQDTQCSQNRWDIRDYDNLLQIHQTLDFNDQNQYVSFGQGFWFQYIPFKQQYYTQNTQIQKELDIINYFMYSLKRISDDSQLLFNFIQLDQVHKTLSYIIYVYTEQSITLKTIPIDILHFEGVWIFFYFYNHYELNKISFYYYQSNLDSLYQDNLDSIMKIQNTESIQSSIRSFIDIKINGQIIVTYPFLGIIKQVESTLTNLLSDINYFKQICQVELLCILFDTQLVEYNQEYTGGFSMQELNDLVQQNTFKLSGWVKQNELSQDIKLDSVLLRLAISSENDLLLMDQQLLYITYHQHTITSLNGFTASTYSYSIPQTYQSNQVQTFEILDESLGDLLTQWHLIQYEEGSQINEGQPIYRVYFPQNNKFIECKWNNQIYHFSSVNLYFYIGGDTYSINNFQGYLSEWKFQHYCQKNFESSYEVPCHKSCQTCKGISANDCLSCSLQSNRIFSLNDNQCVCMDGYLENYETLECKSLSDFNGAFKINYLEILCNKPGYYKCDESNIQCDYGYFEYHGACIACPHKSNDVKLSCALCYLSPNIFNQTLVCEFDFVSTQAESPFYYFERYYSLYEIFKINFDNHQEFTPQLSEGQYSDYNQIFCKNGYFMLQGECHQCLEGCFTCDTEYYCHQCDLDYFLTDQGNCKQCTKCVYCYFQNDEEFCQYDFTCLQQQYFENNQCLNCGQNCQQCNSEQCFYCIDSSKYYLGLDGINCGICSIQNCQYCFEYTYQKDNELIISIDKNRDYIQLDMYEIQLGCAQCKKGFFYSFETKKCELFPDDMKECDVGVSLLENNGITCLKSQSLKTSIQSTDCEESELCLECINNYSSELNSFCIVCKEGYYSNIQSGLCKQCPSSCKTCAQQSVGTNDYWKWEIKAFYQHFVNYNGQHPFEIYAIDSDIFEQKLACLSCKDSHILYNNICYQGCDDKCEDCRMVGDETIIDSFSARCFKCKSSGFNSQRSYQFDNQLQQMQSQCGICPLYCSACYPRTSEEIQSINQFFNQTSEYLKYSHKCYYIDNYIQHKSILPEILTLQTCGELKRCTKTIDASFKVFQTIGEMLDAIDQETNPNLRDIYQYFYSISVYDKWSDYETPQILEYYNLQTIEEISINYQLESPVYYQDFGMEFKNLLKQNIFYLKKVNFKIYTLNKDIIFRTKTNFMVINFDKIVIENINFWSPLPYYQSPDRNVTHLFYFENQYYPQIVIFKNVNFIQTWISNYLDFSIICNRSSHFTITNTDFNLNLTDSLFFQYYPQTNQEISYLIVENLTIFNNVLYNSILFYFFAENNTLNSIISFKNVTIQNTLFTQNSSFITSNFLKNFDIGELYLENFTIKDVIFQNSSYFISILSGKKIQFKNFKLVNIKFLDKSSFFIGNTLNIYDFEVEQCYIQFGYIITNYGKFSESIQVRKSSENLTLENITFKNNIYFQEKSLIYLVQQQVENISLSVQNLYLYNNEYIDVQVGKQSYSFVSSDLSQLYFECSYCTFKDLKLTRGLGYPELTIKNSKYLEIINFNIELNPQFEFKPLHSSIDCVRNFYYLDLPFVLSVKSFLQVYIDYIHLSNLIIIDYPYFIFEGQSLSDQVGNDLLTINNSIFTQNILIVTQLNRISSLISIQTYRNTIINIQNSTFSENFLNKYEDDTQLHSSSTLIIDSQMGQVRIQDSLFEQNLVTNSSDSNLYIKSEIVYISNCIFLNQNQFSITLLQQNLLIHVDQSNYNDIIKEMFGIMSQGGSGYLFLNELIMLQCIVKNSIAVNGGAFYINSKSEGKIMITKSSFENTSTILNSDQFSSGGVLYIDASKSRLNLLISETQINKAYSRTQGGAIFIDASRTQNQILLQNVSILNTFSFKSSILFFSPSKLQSLISNVFIDSSLFQSTEEEFNIYLSQIQDLSIQDVEPFQKDNSAIYIQYSNFTISNSFVQMHLIDLIQVYNGINININNLEITNSTIFASSIIKVTLRQDIKAILIIKNLVINSLIVHKFTDKDCNYESQEIINRLLCPNDLSQILSNPNVEIKINNNTNQLNCNLNLISTQYDRNFSLIELTNFQELHQIFLENIEFKQCHCSDCYFGLISIQQFEFSTLKLKISKMKIQNNTCGTLGCLSILKSLEQDSQELEKRLLSVLDLERIEFIPEFNIQIKIEDSQFLNNKAQYGGACYISSVNFLMDNCQLIYNEAKYKGGGIYYYSNNTQISIINSMIVNNSANIAGGIYLRNNQMTLTNQMNLFIKNNKAQSFGDNVLEYPKQLKIKMNSQIILENKKVFQNKTAIIEEALVEPYYIFGESLKTQTLLLPSGIKISNYKYFDYTTNSYLNYNLSLRILAINSFGEQIIDLSNSFCQIYAQEINDTQELEIQQLKFDSEITKQYLSKNKIEFNLTSGDYNLDDLIIYFNPQSDYQTVLLLSVNCDQVQVPQFNEIFPYEKKYVITNYFLQIKLRTFKCQLGEYFNSTSGGCIECDTTQNQYSVAFDALKCEYRDEVKMKNLQPAMIELREGFWRAYYYSNNIEECYHLKLNCQGGWYTGDRSCYIGHIGALCEQCDLYNIQGQGSFSVSQQYTCSSCEDIAANIVTIVFVLLWTLMSVFLSVNSTIKLIEEFIFYTKLKAFGKHIIFSASQTSVLLKVFTNYLQIITSISTFQLSIPVGILLTFKSVGNPVESMSFSLDCYLVQMTSIPILYFRILWGFFMVAFYILLFVGLHLMLLIFNNKKMSITFITTTLIYIYIYLSPNIISGLVALLSYRNISNEQWITGNVAYHYNTNQHRKWLYLFIIPSFIIIGILLPLLFWFVVYYNRVKLNTSKVRKIWGYLYNEYKLETYYWETIKILEKEFIIYVLIYYEDYVAVKSSLIFFVLLLYGYLTNQYKPYETGDLNKIDSLQTAICKVSIILAQTIYTSQRLNIEEIVIPCYFLLALLNIFFIVRVITKILFAYFNKLSEQVDKVKRYISFKFPYIIKNNKYCFRLFRNSEERKQLIRKRFQLIKTYLIQQARQIIQYKQLYNMDFGEQKSLKEYDNIMSEPFSSSRNLSKLLRTKTNLQTARLSRFQLTIKSQEN